MVLVAFAAVYILWGSTYFFIRIGVETIPPFVLAGIRHIAIGLVFYPLFRYQSKETPTPAQWRTTEISSDHKCKCQASATDAADAGS